MKKGKDAQKKPVNIIKSIVFFFVVFSLAASVKTIGGIFLEKISETEELSTGVVEEITSIYEELENKRRNEDYQKGEAGMPGDGENILEDEPDSEEGNIMCQDLYDANGNLLWEGLTQQEAEKADEELVKQWEKMYEIYSNGSAEVGEDTELYVENNSNPGVLLTNLCVEYYEKIPYAADSFSYYKGYEKKDTYDNIPYIKNGQVGAGLGNLGYVTWVMRNVTGHTPKALKGKKFQSDKAKKVKKEHLKAGDICVSGKEEGKRYGIVVDIMGKEVIVAVCDSVGNEKFPSGSAHFVYLEDGTKKYIGDYPSVAFDEFYRLPEFEEGEQ